MTDFHKLFMVKVNKMIKKKTGASFLVLYVIYVALCIHIARKLSCLLPLLSAFFIPFMQLLKGN